MELRKRRGTSQRPGGGTALETFVDAAAGCSRLVVFTGSGISATSGMSMFSTRNGLYERARKRFKIQDGIKLFTYSFYKQRRSEVQAFFAQIYSEAQASQAAEGHYALGQILEMQRLQRHYTLNIDGLSEVVGMDTWHHERNPDGSTVEMHGNIRQLVCPSCHAVEPLSRACINAYKAQQALRCKACGEDDLRFKVMLYDDDEGDCITPEHVFDVLEEDLKVADMVVWVGISFQQSASVEYFRKVRHLLGTLGRLNTVKQVLINPSDEPYFNLLSAVCNAEDLDLMDVRATSDEALPALAKRMRQHLCGIDTTPPPAPSGSGGSALPAERGAALEQGAPAAAVAAPRQRRTPRPPSGGGGRSGGRRKHVKYEQEDAEDGISEARRPGFGENHPGEDAVEEQQGAPLRAQPAPRGRGQVQRSAAGTPSASSCGGGGEEASAGSDLRLPLFKRVKGEVVPERTGSPLGAAAFHAGGPGLHGHAAASQGVGLAALLQPPPAHPHPHPQLLGLQQVQQLQRLQQLQHAAAGISGLPPYMLQLMQPQHLQSLQLVQGQQQLQLPLQLLQLPLGQMQQVQPLLVPHSSPQLQLLQLRLPPQQTQSPQQSLQQAQQRQLASGLLQQLSSLAAAAQ